LLTGAGLLALVLFLVWVASIVSRRTTAEGVTLDAAEVPSLHSNSTGVSGLRNESSSDESGQHSTDAPASASVAAGQATAQIILQYGEGEGELGMVRENGQTPVGPESFAVSWNGDILVADVVNHRVLVCTSNGNYLRSIELPGVALGDVMADEQGRVYVYDQVRHALHQYGADGALQSVLALNPADIDTRGYFHIANHSVYFADAAVRDVLVATLEDGVLRPPPESAERLTGGIHAASGRIYLVNIIRDEALQLQIREAAEQHTSRTLEVTSPGIVSARYVGEDLAQRFYIQIERLAENSVVLEVLAFSAAGEPLTARRMPENDYALWTAKLVDVRADGTIVQFLPQREQASLNFFLN